MSKSTFKAILPYIRAKLVLDEICQGEQIGYALDGEQVPPLMTGTVILLRPGRSRRGDLGGHDPVPGSGRHDTRVTRTLTVEIRTPQMLDHVGDALVAMTDATVGHLTVEDAVFDSLQAFHPTTGAGVELTAGPLEWMGGGPAARDRIAEGWAVSVMTFDVPLIQDLVVNGSFS